MILIAVIGDFYSPHQFHDKVRTAGFSCAGIQDPGDIGMIHHGQGLALGFEPGDHTAGIHAEFDYLERHTAADWLSLFGHIDYAAAAFPELFTNLVMPDYVA